MPRTQLSRRSNRTCLLQKVCPKALPKIWGVFLENGIYFKIFSDIAQTFLKLKGASVKGPYHFDGGGLGFWKCFRISFDK